MKTYVLGLSFSKLGGWVLLIKKTKPEWQKGLYNGIGGKVEPFEKFVDAMVREYFEETGIQTKPENWTEFGQLKGTDWNGGKYVVAVYYMFSDVVYGATTTTEEVVQLVPACELDRYSVVPNLKWIVPMCINAYAETGISRLIGFEARYA
jgi:8-oxo-dGTP diphosphatase